MAHLRRRPLAVRIPTVDSAMVRDQAAHNLGVILHPHPDRAVQWAARRTVEGLTDPEVPAVQGLDKKRRQECLRHAFAPGLDRCDRIPEWSVSFSDL